MNHLQWMGAVRMRAQKAYKNIAIILTTPVHQLKSCEMLNVWKKNVKVF